jgi:hypothetical protein
MQDTSVLERLVCGMSAMLDARATTFILLAALFRSGDAGSPLSTWFGDHIGQVSELDG